MLSDVYDVILSVISIPFEVGGQLLTRSVGLCDGRTTSCSVVISLVVVILLVMGLTEMLRWKMSTFDPASEFKLPRSSHVGFFTRIFYSVLGSDPDIVMLCTWRDRAKRAAMGWFLIVTTGLAFFSALVLSQTIAEAESGFSSGEPILFALVFSIFIFSFDRVMIMSEYNRVIVALRVTISVVVAIFVGSSVAVWVFSATIDRYRLDYAQQEASPAAALAARADATASAGSAQAAEPATNLLGVDTTLPQLEALLQRTEGEQTRLQAELQRNQARADDLRAERAVAERTLEDVQNIRCLLVNMQAEVQRGTARGFPCPAFRHLVREDIRQSSSAGLGKNYLQFSNAVVRLYQERKDDLPSQLAIREEFLRLPLSAAVAPNPAEVRNALQRTETLLASLQAYLVLLSGDQEALAAERRRIEARLDEIRPEIRDYRTQLAGVLAEAQQEQDRVAEMFFNDIVARHVTMFRIIGEEPLGHGFLMLVFIVLLLVMDMSVVLAKLALKTPQYDELCEKHEQSATAIAEEFLKTFKIRRALAEPDVTEAEARTVAEAGRTGGDGNGPVPDR